MKLSLQSRYQVRPSFALLTNIVFTCCLLSASAQRWKRDSRWALVRRLNHNLASGKIFDSFEGTYELVGDETYRAVRWALEVWVATRRCWRPTLTHLRSCRPDIFILSATSPFPPAVHYLRHGITLRTLQSGMKTSANADELFSTSAWSQAYRTRTSSLPPS